MTKYEILADLMFPNVTKTIDDLEKIYPPRELPNGAHVTRFGPSPTGFLHTGSLFAAMISAKFAHQSDGVFYLRLEDTDKKREIEGSGELLSSSLKKFGIYTTEGYDGDNEEKGNYGPYVQSMRKDIYDVVIKYLVSKNQAYPCFCTHEELEKNKNIQEANKEQTGYYGKYASCSFLSVDEAIEKVKAGQPYVVRFRSLGDHNQKIKFTDLIRGEIEMEQNDTHTVIMKSDGLPTYHFAHVVDDHFMRTTIVTRGEEWLPSTPKHIEMFEALNWQHPGYVHLSNIMKLDNGVRRKLSKRKDPEAAVSFYLEQGYPTKGFMKYLYTLANSNFEEWALANPTLDKDEFQFSFEKMSKDGALFDLDKAKFFCKEYLGNLTTEDFVNESKAFAKVYDQNLYNFIIKDENYYKAIIAIEREQEKPRKDYEKFSDVYELIKFFDKDIFDEMAKEGYNFPEQFTLDEVKTILTNYLSKLDLSLTEEEWFNKMKECAVECNLAQAPKEFKKNPGVYKGHVGDVAGILRITLSLRSQTPNLYYIMKVLGKDEVIRRINKVLK